MERCLRFYWIVFVFNLVVIGNRVYGSAENDSLGFGEVLGQNNGVVAYSNQNDSLISRQFIDTGMKWQCVEYARRWLTEVKKVSFLSVEYAFEIWDLKEGFSLETRNSVLLQHFENGLSLMPPNIGDLIIYNSNFAPITGHVAVVVAIQDTEIMIAEQNYSAQPWLENSYSRRLKLSKEEKGTNSSFYLHDSALGIIGWVRFSKQQ